MPQLLSQQEFQLLARLAEALEELAKQAKIANEIAKKQSAPSISVSTDQDK